MTKQWQALCALVISTALFGCGGGGGTGSGGLTTNIFTTWSAVDPPENVAATGISQDADYNADPDNPPVSVTNYGVSKNTDPLPTVTIRYRADGTIERIAVVTPNVVLSWDETTGDTITDADGDPWVIATDSAESEMGILFNPLEMDPAEAWEYQTFGVWATGRGINGAIGAMSVGTPTPDNAIPTFDRDITFTGYSAGIYALSDGTVDGTAAYRTESDVTVTLNFADPAHELVFRTSGTKLTDIETGTEWTVNPPSLDMLGTLSYTSDKNTFTGAVTATGLNAVLTGESTGQFYGPVAEELGGVFSLSGQVNEQNEYYSGAYGAARP